MSWCQKMSLVTPGGRTNEDENFVTEQWTDVALVRSLVFQHPTYIGPGFTDGKVHTECPFPWIPSLVRYTPRFLGQVHATLFTGVS